MISNQSNNEQTEIKKTFSYNEDSNVISEQPFDEETSKKNLMIEKRENMTFFAYCWDQPMIIVHHLFIGGFGFLVIVVSYLIIIVLCIYFTTYIFMNLIFFSICVVD